MQLGLTQEDLANRMGTSHSVISRLESGQHRFSFATMRKLAKALDTHLVYGFQDEAPDSKSRRTPKRELGRLRLSDLVCKGDLGPGRLRTSGAAP